MDQCHYVFVYGTLRKHERNHQLLDAATLVAQQAWTNGSLYDTGLDYPALEESETETVYGELYLVSVEQLQKLDQLEGYVPDGKNNHNNRKKQVTFYDTGKIEAFIYTAAMQSMLKTPIKSGDWRVHRLLRQKSTLHYFAYGSCMDRERFKKANVDHLFQTVSGRGTLEGYSLRYTYRAVDGGRADIVEEGGVVEGKVYEINHDCLRYLFIREGVETGCYRAAFVDLSLNGRVVEDVLTFIVVKKEAEIAPPNHYSEEILRGGSGFLSESYLEILKDQLKKLG